MQKALSEAKAKNDLEQQARLKRQQDSLALARENEIKKSKETEENRRLAAIRDKARQDSLALADATQRQKAEAERLEKEKAEAKNPENESEAVIQGKIGSSEARKNIPQALGANKYKEHFTRGNELYKQKRYAEAKTSYEEALKSKPDDAAAKAKLAEVEKLIVPK